MAHPAKTKFKVKVGRRYKPIGMTGHVVPIYGTEPACAKCGRGEGEWLMAEVGEDAVGQREARQIANKFARLWNEATK